MTTPPITRADLERLGCKVKFDPEFGANYAYDVYGRVFAKRKNGEPWKMMLCDGIQYKPKFRVKAVSV